MVGTSLWDSPPDTGARYVARGALKLGLRMCAGRVPSRGVAVGHRLGAMVVILSSWGGEALYSSVEPGGPRGA